MHRAPPRLASRLVGNPLISNIDPDKVEYNGKMYNHLDKDDWREQVSGQVTAPGIQVALPGVSVPLGVSLEVTAPAVLRYLDDSHDVRSYISSSAGSTGPANEGGVTLATQGASAAVKM